MLSWIMAKKDIKRMIRDKKALIITILMPGILTLILGFSVGGFVGNEVNIDQAKVGVVPSEGNTFDTEKLQSLIESNLDLSSNDQLELMENLEGLDFEEIFFSEVLEHKDVKEFVAYEELAREEALKKLKKGELTSVVIFPENFNNQLMLSFLSFQPSRVKIELIHNPDEAFKSDIFQSIVQTYTDQISVFYKSKDVLIESSMESGVGFSMINQVEEFINQISSAEKNVTEVIPSNIEGRNKIDGLQYYAIGMGVMFMMFSAAFGASYALQEKQQHTIDRILLSGCSLGKIISGRFIATSLFVFGQLAILIVMTIVFFGIQWGNYGNIFIMTLVASLAVGSLSVLLSSINLLCNNEKMTNLFQSIVIPLFSLLGGSFISTSFMPEFMQFFGKIMISGAVMQGYLKIIQGYQLFELSEVFVAIFANSILFLLISYAVFKRVGELK